MLELRKKKQKKKQQQKNALYQNSALEWTQ